MAKKAIVNHGQRLVGAFIGALLIVSALPAFAGGDGDAWTDRGRFTVLSNFNGRAVLDTETGIVWERVPSGSGFTWSQAQTRCNTLVLGARMGWRLPTLQELTSILDVGAAPDNLTPGHPFTVIPPWNVGEVIWSATTSASNSSQAWTMNLAGSVLNNIPKNSLARCWCVRFRQGVDPQ